ncbi:CD2-associated protein-like isoform X2 [Planococcus citri]|uniref:CD2-associated protein-like isoform X2 n=1 Tax=Planococcus citri TaxID=170843 RepID=UPI0031F9E2D4
MVLSDNMNSISAGTPLCGKKFRVKYNYIPANVDELELHVNDIVEVISEIEEGWWEGKLRNTIGVFPSNFVTEITEAELAAEKDTSKTDSDDEVLQKDLNDGPVLPPKPKQVKEMCLALFPYEAKHEDELTLKENDVILLLSTDLPDKGWWKGQLYGKIGVFPDNFVKLIAVDEDTLRPDKSSHVKTNNKMSDAVPKLPSYNEAALRKSIQSEDVIQKPVVSKKPSSTEQVKSSNEKTSASPERNINASSLSSSETSSLIKSDHERSRIDLLNRPNVEAPRGKSFSTVTSINEKLNAEFQAAFAAKEAETVVDGGSSSKVYKIDHNKHTVKKEPSNSKIESVTGREVDLNAIQRAELLTHPTASRAKAPKRRPPSGINFKEDDDLVVNNKPMESTKSVISVNGTADPVNDKAKSFPWVEELKLNQAKKNSTQVNLRSGFTSMGSNVTFRFQRPVSMYSGDSSEPNVSSTFQETNDVSKMNSQVSALPDKNSDKLVTIPASEWNALNEKVNNLEQRLEQQAEFFRKSIDQLKIKLAKEIENRLEMKNEIDKLTDLVTQV